MFADDVAQARHIKDLRARLEQLKLELRNQRDLIDRLYRDNLRLTAIAVGVVDLTDDED